MKYKVGDYFLTKNKDLLRIVDEHIWHDGTASYDVRSLNNPGFEYKVLHADKLDLLGKVIKESENNDMMSLLFNKK